MENDDLRKKFYIQAGLDEKRKRALRILNVIRNRVHDYVIQDEKVNEFLVSCTLHLRVLSASNGKRREEPEQLQQTLSEYRNYWLFMYLHKGCDQAELGCREIVWPSSRTS